MPWQPAGTFLRVNPDFSGATVWQQDQAATIKIIASRHDYHDEDLGQGIQQCLNINGLNAMAADLDMDGNNIINLPGGSLATEGALTPQLIDPATGANHGTMQASPENSGWYVRNGRVVMIFCRVACSAHPNDQKAMAIDGMPFTIDPTFAGAHLGMYATGFLAGEGMPASGIGGDTSGITGGATWNPEAQMQGVVPIEPGVIFDPIWEPGVVTAGTYIHLRTYFGTNNFAVNGYDGQQPYFYNVVDQTAVWGFQMMYMTNDPL